MAKDKKSKSYISQSDFIEIALANKCYVPDIVKQVQASIDPKYSPQAAYTRVKAFREKGLLPLESGNYSEESMRLKKVSTMYGPDGEVKLQWVSSDRDKEDQLQAFSDAVSSIVSTVRPIDRRPSVELDCMESSMSVYTIGDAHIGMLAWHEETGEDYDLNIALSRHRQAMSMLVSQSNPTQQAFIVDVGEIADNKSGN